MPVGASRMDRRVRILQPVKSKDGYNSDIVTWHPLVSCWAEVTPIKDSERLRAGEELSLKASRFLIRYSGQVSRVDPTFRLMFDGVEYDINGVKEVGRRLYLELTATARGEKP